jgi:hypothetical protein
MARHGSAGIGLASRAWCGAAGLGRARQGGVGRGAIIKANRLGGGLLWQVEAWRGMARRGAVRRGMPWQGEDVFTFRKSLKNGFEAIRDFDSWCESVVDA